MQKSSKKGTDEVKLVSSEAMRIREFRKRKSNEEEIMSFIASMGGIVTQHAIKSAKDCEIPSHLTDFCAEKSSDILMELRSLIRDGRDHQKEYVDARKKVWNFAL